MTDDELKKIGDRYDGLNGLQKMIDSAVRSALVYEKPSRETAVELERLKGLQQNFMDKLNEFQSDNKEAHNAIVVAIEKLEKKLDNVIVSKASQEQVDKLQEKTDGLIIWKASIAGVGAVVLFLLYAFRDYLLGKL